MVPTNRRLLPSPEWGRKQFQILRRQHHTNLPIRFMPPWQNLCPRLPHGPHGSLLHRSLNVPASPGPTLSGHHSVPGPTLGPQEGAGCGLFPMGHSFRG